MPFASAWPETNSVSDASGDASPAPFATSIAAIPATNAPIQPPPTPPDRYRETLEALDEPFEWEDREAFAPGTRLIAAMEIDGPLDEAGVLERLELVRVQHVLEESDQLAQQRAHDSAIRNLENELETLEFDQSIYIVHHRLGTMLFRTQDYEEAAWHMEQALEIQPENAALASNLAAVQMTLGYLDEAMDTLSGINLRIIDNAHLLFSIHFNLACLHSLKGNHERAIENLFTAVEHDAPNTYASLGDTQLDPIRDDLRFRDLATSLERHLRPAGRP